MELHKLWLDVTVLEKWNRDWLKILKHDIPWFVVALIVNVEICWHKWVSGLWEKESVWMKRKLNQRQASCWCSNITYKSSTSSWEIDNTRSSWTSKLSHVCQESLARREPYLESGEIQWARFVVEGLVWETTCFYWWSELRRQVEVSPAGQARPAAAAAVCKCVSAIRKMGKRVGK